jgi:PRC-barrel domain
VAALALAIPAMAQDEAVPSDTEQSATPETEQTEPGLQQEGAPEGATEQAPAMTEEAPAETDEAPTMTEELPAEEPAEDMAADEATPPADMEFLQVQEEAQFLADYEVIGADVHNNMDEKVGTIADLVLDQDQKLVGVVLSVGGFLGIGEKWVAVPVEQIDFPSAEQPARLLATVTEEQLTNAPDFTTREALEAEQAASDAAMQQQAPAPAVPAQ